MDGEGGFLVIANIDHPLGDSYIGGVWFPHSVQFPTTYPETDPTE